MKINRLIKAQILEKLRKTPKAIVLYGPRQVGKTTLGQDLIAELGLKTLAISADEQRFTEILSSRDGRRLAELVEGVELLFIDEAQRIPNIGLNLKIIIDNFPNLKIITTGSSSFELANQVAEPLTGRKWTFHLYPISQVELLHHFAPFELRDRLAERLIWGAYPELWKLSGRQNKEDYLRELSSDYLYKDILAIAEIRHADKLRNLLKLIAFQIGNEVSLNELSHNLDLSKETVSRYLNLLEKSFVLFRLSGFSRNLRKEITKNSKYYFYDLGIRNCLIDNFKDLFSRNDQGALWENFLIIERLKRNVYLKTGGIPYFWRTYSGAEIDYIEESGDNLLGTEIKWKNKKAQAPKLWLNEYKEASWQLVNPDNWLDFVTK